MFDPGTVVPSNRPGDVGRRINEVERQIRDLSARLTPAASPITSTLSGDPLAGTYDGTQGISQVIVRVAGPSAASTGLLAVPLGDSMSAVLSATSDQVLGVSTTPLLLYVRGDLTTADTVWLQTRSVVDGSVVANAAVDAFVTVNYQA